MLLIWRCCTALTRSQLADGALSCLQAGGVDPYATTVMHGTVEFDAAGTVVMHKDEEQYGTVVISGAEEAEDPYKEALRMAQEQYGSREPSPMGASVIAHSDVTQASGYMAAVAHASNEAGV